MKVGAPGCNSPLDPVHMMVVVEQPGSAQNHGVVHYINHNLLLVVSGDEIIKRGGNSVHFS